ncbi:PD-(D/E)XK nuclease family protein [Gloeobacter kilaueensis]|uniref:ATP-dependent exoDNAse (Exonuclease V) beta subunit (Contains helicase and exonuclease domains) n=1 Tax=Gloeobacter kilaueensis (strain ATCC BAA-2537 / CCAP 1431/1 / ULC 316 / JS1) TaxID=1183438 RepID=U5QRD6_GLOK1|nr:PD-(D/E)XK nuclease family protein [Gloeobacter kilaueensis]AGY60214.1 ATP-dependent exoDNAse (exonuclease V) beta subunit (contains helicase and exonuclease domains) [Gloeobacter kilaueensis JS1]
MVGPVACVSEGSERYYRVGEHLYPGVTTILAATRPPEAIEALERWRNRVGVEQAQAIQVAASGRGNRLHALVEQYLRGEPVDTDQAAALQPWWGSVQPALRQIADVRLVEAPLFHPVGCYGGTIDALCRFQGELVALDWKSAERPKRRAWLGDYPLQLAAYLGAVNRLYDLRVASGIIVLAHRQGAARIYRFSGPELRRYWFAWLKRLVQFWSTNDSDPRSAQIVEQIRTAYPAVGTQI